MAQLLEHLQIQEGDQRTGRHRSPRREFCPIPPPAGWFEGRLTAFFTSHATTNGAHTVRDTRCRSLLARLDQVFVLLSLAPFAEALTMQTRIPPLWVVRYPARRIQSG